MEEYFRLGGSNDRTEPEDRLHRVLMIAAAFPPTGGPGIQRTTKFARYLPRFGWLPTVWTIKTIDSLPQDPTLLAEIPPEVTVYAHPKGDQRSRLHQRLQAVSRGRGFVSKIARAIDWRWEAKRVQGACPDQFVSWATASVKPLCDLIQREKIDVIYSTYSPGSNHLLALTLKRRTGLPWVADFRDLWTEDHHYLESLPTRRRSHRQLEQEVLEAADIVIGVTGRQTAILANHVPSRRPKFVTITNGFDPHDFRLTATASSPASATFVMAHVGRMDQWRVSDCWLAGLKRFTDQLEADREAVVLRVVGHAHPTTLARLRTTEIQHVFTGYVSHEQAVHEMQSADALLLIVSEGPNAESSIPAKLFEYLAARRPILVVGPAGGECEKIVRACRAGLTVGWDEKAIAEALGRLYRAWREGRSLAGCDPERLAPFDRVTLTGRLAAVMDRLVAESQGPRRITGVLEEAGTR